MVTNIPNACLCYHRLMSKTNFTLRVLEPQICVIRENFYHRGLKGGTEFAEIYLCVLCPTGRPRTAFSVFFVVKYFGCGLLRYGIAILIIIRDNLAVGSV